jgi:hypothetical protein
VEPVVLEVLAVHLEVSQAVTPKQRRALAHKKNLISKLNKCPIAYSFAIQSRHSVGRRLSILQEQQQQA